MTIVRASKELTAKDIYNLTMNRTTTKMKDAKGERLELCAWAVYEDVNKKTGEVQNILTIRAADGKTYATNSPTFVTDFVDMVELFEGMGENVPAIVVASGTSNAGREYITCVYSD